MRVKLHPEARAEARAAALWYDEQRPGLGDELMLEVSATLEKITRGPRRFQVWPGTEEAPRPIRRAVVQRFPYLIAFEASPENIFVLAIAHQKRRPLYWLTRSSSGI